LRLVLSATMANIAVRTTQLADNFTTCVQAEALYPGETLCEVPQASVRGNKRDQDEVYAQMHMVGVFGVDVIIDPKRFR